MKAKTKSGNPAYTEVQNDALLEEYKEMITTIRHNACFIQVRHRDNPSTQRDVEEIKEALENFIKQMIHKNEN